MLEASKINTKVLNPLFKRIFQGVEEDLNLLILEDRQDAPRPLLEQFDTHNWLYYGIEKIQEITPHFMNLSRDEVILKGGIDCSVIFHCLGGRAVDINSIVRRNFYRSDIWAGLYSGYRFYPYDIGDFIDLTEVESGKWLRRIDTNFTFSFYDKLETVVDTFDSMDIDIRSPEISQTIHIRH